MWRYPVSLTKKDLTILLVCHLKSAQDFTRLGSCCQTKFYVGWPKNPKHRSIRDSCSWLDQRSTSKSWCVPFYNLALTSETSGHAQNYTGSPKKTLEYLAQVRELLIKREPRLLERYYKQVLEFQVGPWHIWIWTPNICNRSMLCDFDLTD